MSSVNYLTFYPHLVNEFLPPEVNVELEVTPKLPSCFITRCVISLLSHLDVPRTRPSYCLQKGNLFYPFR